MPLMVASLPDQELRLSPFHSDSSGPILALPQTSPRGIIVWTAVGAGIGAGAGYLASSAGATPLNRGNTGKSVAFGALAGGAIGAVIGLIT